MNALFRVISLCFCVIQWPFCTDNSRSSFVRLFIIKNLFFALMLNGAFVFTSLALDKLSTFLPFLSSKARGGLRLLSSSVRRVVVVGIGFGMFALRARHTNRIPSNLELWNRFSASKSASSVL